MAIQKQGYNIYFGKGVDTKTDPNQVAAGNMLSLQNAVFNKGQLQKRNGFSDLTTLPVTTQTTLTTLNENLLATGSSLYAFSPDTNEWYNQGIIQPTTLSVLPLVRNTTSQTAPDAAVAANGLSCITYVDTSLAYYQISDSSTGQIIIPRTALPSSAKNPRVYELGRYFIITFAATVAAAPHLQYIAIPKMMPASPSVATDISTAITSITAAYDAYVANNSLYIAWDGTGGTIKIARLDSTLVQSPTHTIAGHTADLMSVTADITGPTPIIYITFWDTTSDDGFTCTVNQNLVDILAPVQVITNVDVHVLTSSAQNNLCKIFYETENVYSYAAIRTDYISRVNITSAGVVTGPVVILRSVGLASKSFIDTSGTIYMLSAYGGSFQPSYFLIDESGNVIMRLAYSNGAGYTSSQVLPNINQNDEIQLVYLIKDLLVSVNKTQGATNTAGIFSQTGINLASFTINNSEQYSSEISRNLHLTGGMLWQYDAIKPVEHSFHVWPEDLEVNTSTTGGFIEDGNYFYIFTYEWTDGQGLLHRSAPSIPVPITTAGGNTSSNTIDVPTLRLTYKVGQNPVRLVGYRWSTTQPIYYQFTSITSPVINNTTVDSIQVADTLANSSIIGNTILYTTGGVIENIAAPANTDSTLYRNRLLIIDAEDENLLWYSKQVVQGIPVEMSDLQTIFISPTAGAQGSTGPMKCISSMDDKLIIFKKDAIYYLTGNGPDATGANNDFSEAIFITGTVGSSNPKSIVMTPNGLFFQSDKGIWLLGRDLSTHYIGAPVELYNNIEINSALSIPGTNEVRFTLADGTVLMYDYYYAQWATFNGVPAISATLYQGLHTYLKTEGLIRQESPGLYLDGANPVLLSFSTSWLKLTDLQGFQRAYFFYFLGKYLSPHKLNVQIAYDFNPAIVQTTIISPTNFSATYGTVTPYGAGPTYGGSSNIEQWRVFLNKQKCQSFQLIVTEMFDASFGTVAGGGLTMSGLNLVVGGKATYPKLSSSESAG